ncbi:MAG: amino acid adenylation domain-containing protein, partial [Planctomycetota bacterium]
MWSRARLDQEVLRLLGWLQAQGVARGSVVAIALPRGPQQIAAVLAVMRAGAACLPLDPSYPEARLKAMLAESAPRLTLDEESLVAAAEAAPAASGTCLAEGDDLAYVIYTSGSTGRPKGVAMPHGPLLNLMAWQAQDGELESAARTLQFAPLSFDVAFQEIFATLGSGGTLVLCEDRDRLDPARLVELLEREAITRLFLPAVALQELAQVGQAHGRHPAVLREVITAGEQLVVTPTLRAWFQGMPEARLVNQYGPSETHVATSFRLPADPGAWPELPPIGQALPGVELLVVDEDDTPVAEGAEGELLLGGLAPARGYLAQPEETAARFITREGEDGRWYRTGDLVRRDEAGELHFLGRADQQVKLRGYRIELGEVEAAIAAFVGVGQAAVARQEGPCGPRLVAYVQAEGEELSLAALRRHLQDHLPAYMVPSAVLLLAEFPRTPSGKLDRNALPTPDRKRPADMPP